jgi:hypothetical protein
MDKETAEMLNALLVIVKTPHIRAYLHENDPKALQQCIDALPPGEKSGPRTIWGMYAQRKYREEKEEALSPR